MASHPVDIITSSVSIPTSQAVASTGFAASPLRGEPVNISEGGSINVHILSIMTMESLTPVVQGFSIIATALAAGTNLSSTIVTLPALKAADPNTLATQFKLLYDHGIAPMASLSLSASVGFAALAYRTTLTPALTAAGSVSYTKRNLYVGAALATIALGPYTKLLMGANIDELSRRAKVVAKKEGSAGADTHDLVKRWGVFNFWRGVMLLSGAVMGTWAALV